MARRADINKENFEKLLSWLDDDREIAGKKYESIRLRLIKIFYARGCSTADDLADETVDRVVAKVGEIAAEYKGDPAKYFYGVAKNVFLEYTRRPKSEELTETNAPSVSAEFETEADYGCLKKCLKELNAEQRWIIINYYAEKKKKKNRRRWIERKLGISNESLRIRIYRIKNLLRDCLENCHKRQFNETL